MLGRSLLLNASGAAKEFSYLDPAFIGFPAAGGYFAGLISHTADGNPTHALIVAPRATGATGTGYTLTTDLAWKTEQTATSNTSSAFDGAANTAAMVAAGINLHPAAKFCVELSIGGFNDFYLPSILELDIAYFNLKPTTALNSTAFGINDYSVPKRTANYTTTAPAQTSVLAFRDGQSEAFTPSTSNANAHWSSTQQTTLNANGVRMDSASRTGLNKLAATRVRAFRRVSL
jgi:hypothetical protein